MKLTFKQFLIEVEDDKVDWPKDKLIVAFVDNEGSPLEIVGINDLPPTTTMQQLYHLIDLSNLSQYINEDFDFICGPWIKKIPWGNTKLANSIHQSYKNLTFGRMLQIEYWENYSRWSTAPKLTATWQEFVKRMQIYNQENDFED